MTSVTSAGPPAGVDLPDGPLRSLDRYWWEVAAELREPGLVLDRDPDAMVRYLDLTAVRFMREYSLPPEYRVSADLPRDLMEAGASTLGVVIIMERAAYGDPNFILCTPGPSLSGAIIRALADERQAKRFYGRLSAAPEYTFFGLTEPDKGSAVGELTTSLTESPDGDGWLLNGEKRYVGNGAVAGSGVVFCRRAPGPWGIEAVLFDTSWPGFTAHELPMIGLRGARISALRFRDVPVPAENLLGARLRPSQRGLRGALTGLYQFRPGIAAMALGCAQAAHDYLREHRPRPNRADQAELDALGDRTAAIRRLLHDVAAGIDHGAVNPHRIGAVKAQAAHVAEEMTLLVARLLGPASLIEHPWLEKTYRDVRAFEIMEGTTNLQRLSVFQGLLKGAYLATGDPTAGGPPAGANGSGDRRAAGH